MIFKQLSLGYGIEIKEFTSRIGCHFQGNRSIYWLKILVYTRKTRNWHLKEWNQQTLIYPQFSLIAKKASTLLMSEKYKHL